MLISSKGTLVNIGSVVSRIPVPLQGIYNASKAAVENISRQLRVELTPFDVKVIHVSGFLLNALDFWTRAKHPS